MDYNSIMVPLRLIALGLAAGICIFFLCSFNHPFDIHCCTELAYEDVKREIAREAREQDYACYVSFHNRPKDEYSREAVREWREERDRELFSPGTYDRNDEPGNGTFMD